MCLPLAVIGAIASVAGAGASYAGQQQAEHAKLRAFQAEEARQKGFEAQQQSKFADSLAGANNLADPNAQAAAAQNRDTQLEAVTKNADPVAGGYLPSAGSAPKIVADAGAQAGAKANAATSSLAHAIANMGGWSDLLQQEGVRANHNAQSIDQIGGFMRGSLGALQPEMDAAAQKGGTLRMLGGLAQSIGGAMMGGAGGGGGGPMPVSLAHAAPLASVAPTNWTALLAGMPGMT